jgi:hypothetical protein
VAATTVLTYSSYGQTQMELNQIANNHLQKF